MTAPAANLGELLVKAYQGEVFGEALFADLARRWPAADADRRAKLDILVRLESSTKHALRPTLEGRTDDSVEPILALPHVR